MESYIKNENVVTIILQSEIIGTTVYGKQNKQYSKVLTCHSFTWSERPEIYKYMYKSSRLGF